MLNIRTIFINHFASVEITDNRLKAFCLDHINKVTAWLTVHTDIEISALLTAVLTKYNAYFGAITDEAEKLNIQRSLTTGADNAWTALLNFISQQEGTVKGVFGKDSPEYQQFYPHGITEYIRSTRLDRDTLLARYLTVATSFSADLPADFVTDYTTLKNDWSTKYAAQQNQIGLVKDADSQTASTRVPLELQLSLNMLIIGSKNIGYPDRVSEFFTQSIIRRQRGETIPASSLVIRGKVVIAGGDTPVVNADVLLEDPSGGEPTTTVTDDEGNYEFRWDNLPAGIEGVFIIKIDAPGFLHYENTINFKVGKIYTEDVSLDLGMMKKAA